MSEQQPIRGILVEELNSLTTKNEVVIDDLWSYERFIELTGVEPTSREFYITVELPDGSQAEVCATCFAGAGCWSAVEPILAQRATPEFVQEVKGHIYYNVDAMTRELLSVIEKFSGTTRQRVRRYLEMGLAHERRHSVQPERLFVFGGSYIEQPHEQDACEFSQAVFEGKATLNDVAAYATNIWDPAEEG